MFFCKFYFNANSLFHFIKIVIWWLNFENVMNGSFALITVLGIMRVIRERFGSDNCEIWEIEHSDMTVIFYLSLVFTQSLTSLWFYSKHIQIQINFTFFVNKENRNFFNPFDSSCVAVLIWKSSINVQISWFYPQLHWKS